MKDSSVADRLRKQVSEVSAIYGEFLSGLNCSLTGQDSCREACSGFDIASQRSFTTDAARS